MNESSGLRDALHAAFDMARDLAPCGVGIIGYGVCELRDGDGVLIALDPFTNLITDSGDTYYAAMAMAVVPPVNTAQPAAKLTGMQIGSGSTAVAKAGAGGAMVTLLAGQAFDASYPQTASLGANLGANATYKTTYAAGTGTGTVAEATVTTGTIGVASTVGNTVARALVGPYTKAAGDSLAITWNHKFLGA